MVNIRFEIMDELGDPIAWSSKTLKEILSDEPNSWSGGIAVSGVCIINLRAEISTLEQPK